MSDERNRLKIFVGNLPFNCDNKAVQLHFEGCGKIVGVNVSSRPTLRTSSKFKNLSLSPLNDDNIMMVYCL